MERGRIPEAWLRRLWMERRLPSPLTTTDGRPIEIRRAGHLNCDAGPDFTDAILRIGGTIYRGDVEIHVRADDWRTHGHHADPHYNRVILHAAARSPHLPVRTATGRTIPLLLLPSPHEADILPFIHEPAPPCASYPPLNIPRLRRLLLGLSFRRLGRKLTALHDRLERLRTESAANEETDAAAWDQLLYEGCMEGLGYATNREAFLTLARNVPLRLLRRFDLNDAELIRGVLFGAAGLLRGGGMADGGAAEDEMRRLRTRWRGARRQLRIPIMHEADWRFFRLRPANFPTARLAAWSFLVPRLFCNRGMRSIVRIFAAPRLAPSERQYALRALLHADVGGYWGIHHRFDDEPAPHGAAIGRGRANDIILNTMIPAALLSARVFGLRQLDGNAHALYRAFPPLQQNRATLFVQKNLLRGALLLSTAHLQQGALELYRDWCRNRHCAQCPVKMSTQH